MLLECLKVYKYFYKHNIATRFHKNFYYNNSVIDTVISIGYSGFVLFIL